LLTIHHEGGTWFLLAVGDDPDALRNSTMRYDCRMELQLRDMVDIEQTTASANDAMGSPEVEGFLYTVK
jgi:hypothetical protein